ncbi:XrtA/PEP-CTERM system exopolysaccharide export protein [Aquisalinus luteolus]
MKFFVSKLGAALLLLLVAACSSTPPGSISDSLGRGPIPGQGPGQASQAAVQQQSQGTLLQASPEYLIGPLDELNIFVWRAPELSGDVTVRPDGRISTPLVQDMQAAGKSPTQLAVDLQRQLSEYVRNPEVTVSVKKFSSTFDQQVRVLGEAQRPVALPYQAGMTVLDVMVAVGGLTEFAAGNKAVLIRGQGENKRSYRLQLDDLMRRADVKANVPVLPGDVILIPESIF